MSHRLHYVLTLPLPRSEVLPFFADAVNLERITPASPRSRMVSPLPIEMKPGALIDYRLELYRIPFRWRTRVTVWEPDECFVDEQVRGPYRQWVHTHRFREVDGGTEIEDDVRFALPLAPLRDVALPLVRRELERIFAHRQVATRRILLAEELG